MPDFKQRFYKSTVWKKKREKILRRDNYLCQISKRYGKTVEATTVHHIYPLEEYPQYALEDWNLISVGSTVNNQLHDRTTGKLTKMGLDLMHRTRIPETSTSCRLHLVCGLPGSGKTTWVKERLGEFDIVYDLDYLCGAFTYGPAQGKHRESLARFVNGLLWQIVQAHEKSSLGRLYVIRAVPNERDYDFLISHGAEIHICNTAPDICRGRLIARDGELPNNFGEIVRRWREFSARIPPTCRSPVTLGRDR